MRTKWRNCSSRPLHFPVRLHHCIAFSIPGSSMASAADRLSTRPRLAQQKDATATVTIACVVAAFHTLRPLQVACHGGAADGFRGTEVCTREKGMTSIRTKNTRTQYACTVISTKKKARAPAGDSYHTRRLGCEVCFPLATMLAFISLQVLLAALRVFLSLPNMPFSRFPTRLRASALLARDGGEGGRDRERENKTSFC